MKKKSLLPFVMLMLFPSLCCCYFCHCITPIFTVVLLFLLFTSASNMLYGTSNMLLLVPMCCCYFYRTIGVSNILILLSLCYWCFCHVVAFTIYMYLPLPMLLFCPFVSIMFLSALAQYFPPFALGTRMLKLGQSTFSFMFLSKYFVFFLFSFFFSPFFINIVGSNSFISSTNKPHYFKKLNIK